MKTKDTATVGAALCRSIAATLLPEAPAAVSGGEGEG